MNIFCLLVNQLLISPRILEYSICRHKYHEKYNREWLPMLVIFVKFKHFLFEFRQISLEVDFSSFLWNKVFF